MNVPIACPNYDGLRLVELDGTINDSWLIVCIEAALYCKLNGTDSVGFNRLRERCDEVINRLTVGKRNNLGGTYGRIIKNPSYRRYFDVHSNRTKGRKATHIYPHIQVIEDEVRKRIHDNIDSNKRVLWSRVPRDDKIICERKVEAEPPVLVSERGPFVKVTRANPQQEIE